MKISLILIIAAFFSSCNSTDSSAADTEIIKLRIANHQSKVGLKHKMDSINAEEIMMKKNIWFGESEARRITDSAIKKAFYHNPENYVVTADPHLTYEIFMAYCKEHGDDPMLLSKIFIQ